jgi:hypothetical protein
LGGLYLTGGQNPSKVLISLNRVKLHSKQNLQFKSIAETVTPVDRLSQSDTKGQLNMSFDEKWLRHAVRPIA